MKCDDIVIPSIPEIKTISISSSPRDQVITAASENRASSDPGDSGDSSGSSLSDLRRRLEDLPSPDEFTLLADRVAALGRRICRKRELFLRLHGAAGRIEENDEWEEKDQGDISSECSSRAFRPKDARARRRARIRLESSPSRDDETMVISQSGRSTDSAKITDDKSSLVESADRSARDYDCLCLPAIEIPRRQFRAFSSLSEPSTTRLFHRSDGGSCDFFHDYRSFTPRDGAPRSAVPSVSPFALSSIRPRQFGGYRPSSGVILRNLSSDSESESANETCYDRMINSSIVPSELSSPDAKVVAVNGPTKKMPIMSVRSDITGQILPNLSPSTRSLCDGTWQIEDTREAEEQVPRDAWTFSARSFTSESAGLVTNVRIGRTSNDGSVTKIRNKLKQIESEFENERDEKEEVENYCFSPVTSIVNRDDIEFVRPTGQSNGTFRKDFEIDPSDNANGDFLGVADRMTSAYAEEAVGTSYLIEIVQNDTTEEALSSRTSEPLGSEGHSRSPCTPKIHSQREPLSSERPRNDTDASDKYEQGMISTTNVPTLALNSQDISYSTSAGSRERSAIQSLDPHALIKALSNVSLKQGKEEETMAKKREDFHRQGKDSSDASSGASDVPAKGETWRVPRSSTLDSLGKPLSRIPSRIPIRVSSSKIASSSANKLPGYRQDSNNLNNMMDYEEVEFVDRDDVQAEPSQSVLRQRSEIDLSRSRNCKRDSLPKSQGIVESIEITIGDTRAEDEDDDYERGSLTSSNPQSARSASFTGRVRRRMRNLPENEKNRSSAFLNNAAYSSDRDLVDSRFNDDARSRSDRSTSRKSAETADISSATGSPCVKYKNDASARESRSVDKSVTWRTEDDDNEENPEDARDGYCESYDNKPEDLYSQATERCKSKSGGAHNSPLSKAQRPHVDLSSKVEKVVRKRWVRAQIDFHDDKQSFDPVLESMRGAQSEDLMFQMRRTQEVTGSAAKMSSSALSLTCEPKRKRKSQERFPFTISEALEALSDKRTNEADYQSSDKDFGRARTEERIVHQLKMHPSITRLATAGLEDTVAEIVCCVAQDQKEDESISKSRMRGFARMFSRFRRISKQRDDTVDPEPAKIIYENRVCQVDSKANSSSGGSLTDEADRTNIDKSSDSRQIARSSSMRDKSILKNTRSLAVIPMEHPHRRYDRDDLWVQDFKGFSSENEKNGETSREQDSKEDPANDRYSIFLARNLQSVRSESNVDRDNFLKEKQDVLTSGHVVPSVGKNVKDIGQKVDAGIVLDVEDAEENPTGCLCLRLCRVIAPSKHRLSIRERTGPSTTKKSGSQLRKRKK